METSTDPIAHLCALIGAAKAEADRLRLDSANIPGLLAEALREAEAILAHGDRPDEGLRPQQLTTENDR